MKKGELILDDPSDISNWAPGALCKSQMEVLIKNNIITGRNASELIDDTDHSSMDLRLTDEAYLLKAGTIKPTGVSFHEILQDENLAKKINLEEDYLCLWKTHTYIIKLKERFKPNDFKKYRIYAQATAKGTVGRLDIVARLIVDGMNEYEYLDPDEKNLTGDFYLEITPITFHIHAKPGDKITQIRFFIDRPEISRMKLIQKVFQESFSENRTVIIQMLKMVLYQLIL